MSISRVIRDLSITLFSFTGVSFLYRHCMKKKGPLVRIVVFHDVHDEAWFAGLIEVLVNTYHVLTPEDFFHQRFDTMKINILVTFDDGYASWVSSVAPVLERYGVRGMFFINSGLLDVADDSEKVCAFMRDELMIRPRRPLTWEGAKRLIGAGHTIGSHAYHHVNLASLEGAEIRVVLEKDKTRITEKLGTTVSEVAYPFGTPNHVNETVKSEVQKMGFLRGYTAVSRFVTQSEIFAIPRMCIESTATPRSLRRWVDGGYDIFDMLKQLCVR